MISLDRYRAVMAAEGLPYLYAASIVGRLPIGMSGLAILLLVQGARDSFALGGAATGCYVAGLAGIAPIMGRLIDRRGPRSILLACAALFPASMAALVAAVSAAAPSSVIFACAAAAGISFPPMTVCMRTFLRQRLPDASLQAAYSLDSVLVEVMFIAGPMLVAFFVAFISATASVLFAAGCGLAGVALFLPALRSWRIAPRRRATLLGPLGHRDFVALMAIVLCYCIAFGLTEIGVAAHAAEAQRPALAGVFLGLMSAGSAVGGLAYGSRGWHTPLLRQFGITLGVMGTGLLVLGISWPMAVFAVLSIFAGVVMAPALIIQSILVAKVAKPEHMTEAFTWSTSALLGGVGVGMALGGALVEAWRSPAAFLAAGAAALTAAGGAFWLSRR